MSVFMNVWSKISKNVRQRGCHLSKHDSNHPLPPPHLTNNLRTNILGRLGLKNKATTTFQWFFDTFCIWISSKICVHARCSYHVAYQKLFFTLLIWRWFSQKRHLLKKQITGMASWLLLNIEVVWWFVTIGVGLMNSLQAGPAPDLRRLILSLPGAHSIIVIIIIISIININIIVSTQMQM